MSFLQYSLYKESEIEWLGKLPQHWTIKRLKNIFAERNQRSENGSEELMSVSSYFGVRPRSISRTEGEFLTRAESLEGYKICLKDDLVVNIMLAWSRGLGFALSDGIVSPAYSVFSITDGTLPKFLDFMLRADHMLPYFKAFSTGVIDSRLRLYPDAFGRLSVALPSPKEQKVIVTFLESETSRIDNLIAKQTKLIEVLKEKRQAVISHAVTKGLNPSVSMMDSGIEWLGDVPEHWKAGRLKNIAVVVAGFAFPSSDFIDDGVPVIRISDIDFSGQVSLEEVKYVSERYLALKKIPAISHGDLAMAMTGATIGKAGSYSGSIKAFLNQRVCAIRPKMLIDNVFLKFVISSRPAQEYIRTIAFGGAQPNISETEILECPTTIPSLAEQKTIASYLINESVKFDNLTLVAEKAINLLKERRSALISAAVTGQIDVRGAV